MSSKARKLERKLKKYRRSDRAKAIYVVGNEQYGQGAGERPNSNMRPRVQRAKVRLKNRDLHEHKRDSQEPWCRDDRSIVRRI